ncbi:MAG: ferritin family protein [Desulfuromonadaceae bacterium]
MPYGQAKQILDYARQFHRFASDYFKKLSDSAQQPRMKMLLDYMARHEEHLEEVLKEYETNTKNKAMEAWFQFSNECSIFKPVQNISYTDELTPEKVFEIAAQIDQCMIDSYNTVINRTSNPEVRELFENLLEMEEQEKHVRARTALGLLDM